MSLTEHSRTRTARGWRAITTGLAMATVLVAPARRVLSATSDPRPVVTDDAVKYFGAHLDDASLTPGPGARIAPTRLDDWLSRR